MRRLPPLTALEAFVQVARLGSVKAAAEELALSTPALSRRVQALERFVGKSLFDRKHQAIEINAEGQKLLESIAPALDALAVAVEEIQQDNNQLKLRLSVMPLFAGQRLFPKIPDLRRVHPNLQLELDTSPHGLSRLGEGVDAAIILATEIDPAFYAYPLDHDDVFLIAPREWMDGPDPLTRPEDLRGRTILVHREMPGCFDAWRDAVGMPDLEPGRIESFDSGALVLEAAAQGLGIAVMHGNHLLQSHDPRLVRLFDTPVKSPYRYWFVCRPRALQSRPVRIFHDWLITANL